MVPLEGLDWPDETPETTPHWVPVTFITGLLLTSYALARWLEPSASDRSQPPMVARAERPVP